MFDAGALRQFVKSRQCAALLLSEQCVMEVSSALLHSSRGLLKGSDVQHMVNASAQQQK